MDVIERRLTLAHVALGGSASGQFVFQAGSVRALDAAVAAVIEDARRRLGPGFDEMPLDEIAREMAGQAYSEWVHVGPAGIEVDHLTGAIRPAQSSEGEK
jgi:hypothetical protein